MDYKNVIGSLRAAWRIVGSIEQKEEGRKNEDHVVLVKDYRSKLLADNLIPSAVLYLKMKEDYKYLAEFKDGGERKEAAEGTMLA